MNDSSDKGLTPQPCDEVRRTGEFYWIKDVRGGRDAKWEPARYQASYGASSGPIAERFEGCSGDCYVAELGPRISLPDAVKFRPLERELKDAIAAIVFEPGKSYIVLVAADAIEAEALANLPPGPDCTFVFVYPIPGRAVWEMACRIEIKPDAVLFVDDSCLSEDVKIEGLKIVRTYVPAGRKLRDVIIEPSSLYQRMIEDSVRAQERERCAKVAATYFEWHKPQYPEYCDGDPAEDIATKIRSGQ